KVRASGVLVHVAEGDHHRGELRGLREVRDRLPGGRDHDGDQVRIRGQGWAGRLHDAPCTACPEAARRGRGGRKARAAPGPKTGRARSRREAGRRATSGGAWAEACSETARETGRETGRYAGTETGRGTGRGTGRAA